MDIQKEREAFEKAIAVNIENFCDAFFDEKYYAMRENSRLNQHDKEFLILSLNRSWSAWQARAQAVPKVKNIGKEPQLRVVFEQWAIKASGGWASFSKSHGGTYTNDKLQFAWQALQDLAVPEGFVLIEKDLIQSIYQSCIECLDVDIPPIFRATVCTIRDEVESLIEAQEST